jgi:hypothetical protein
MLKKRVKSHILEKIIITLMILFGFSALYILISTNFGANSSDPGMIAIIQIMIIVLLAIFAQTLILIKIYEKLN